MTLPDNLAPPVLRELLQLPRKQRTRCTGRIRPKGRQKERQSERTGTGTG